MKKINNTMQAQFKIGLILSVIAILVGIGRSCEAQLFSNLKKKPADVYDSSLFDPNYIKLGLDKLQFSEWAKSVKNWNPGSIRKKDINDTSRWDEFYDISVFKTFGNHFYGNDYKYIFYNGICVLMKLGAERSSKEKYDYLLRKNHFFYEERAIKNGWIRWYKSKSGGYLIRVVDTTDVVNSGFEKSRLIEIWVEPIPFK